MRGRCAASSVTSMTFELRWEHRAIGDAARVIEVYGPLLFPDSRLLGDELTHVVRTGTRQLVLDLTEVTDIDSALVGLLVACARQVGWRGGHVAVVSDDEQAGTLRCPQQAGQRPAGVDGPLGGDTGVLAHPRFHLGRQQREPGRLGGEVGREHRLVEPVVLLPVGGDVDRGQEPAVRVGVSEGELQRRASGG